MDLEDQIRERRREERIADFALGSLLSAIQGSMGQSMPAEGDARDLVRLARTVFSEIDQPTEPPEPDDEADFDRPADRSTGDWKDVLYEDEGL